MQVLAKTGQDLTPQLTGAVKERIKELILGNTVVIFSKSYCPFCDKTKRVFRNLEARTPRPRSRIVALHLDFRSTRRSSSSTRWTRATRSRRTSWR